MMKEIEKTEKQIRRKTNLAMLFFSIVIYFVLAFISWEINFAEWGGALRFIFLGLVVCNVFFWTWGKNTLLEEKKKQEAGNDTL